MLQKEEVRYKKDVQYMYESPEHHFRTALRQWVKVIHFHSELHALYLMITYTNCNI